MEHTINSPEDLIELPSFIHWVYQTVPEDIAYWDRWLLMHPEKRQIAEDAAMIVRGITFNKPKTDAAAIDAGWVALSERLAKPGPRLWGWSRQYAVAAAVALLMLSMLSLWLVMRQPMVSHVTAYGETKNLVLPDGSRVTLNANSSLRYQRDFVSDKGRVVYLEGEAFFDVVKQFTDHPLRFVVITEDAEVEVLGTSFNVNNRRGKTRVVLNSGAVKVNMANEQKATLKPGEMMEYDAEEEQLTLQAVDPEVHSAWKNHKLKFDDTSLTELAEILEDTYGLQVKIDNPRLLQEKISGEISAQNADVILKAIAKLFHINISREGNTVYLR